MESLVNPIVGTLLLRPYVFAFFLTYLLGCSLHLGVKRALLFAVIGYGIAWLSEYSSIHNGIPYGYYYYIEQTKDQEIWLLGVPLMDSMSYVFLSYASYSTALMVISPVLYQRGIVYVLETRKIRRSLHARLLGALLFVYLDIIIDPVALLGDRWFLGQIYGYPERGVYFGIPISNFIGWFVVGFLMIYSMQKIDNLFNAGGKGDWSGLRCPWRFLIGPALYFSVLIFNLCVTFFIGEHTLGWVGIFIALLPSALFCSVMRVKFSTVRTDAAIRSHLLDFPKAVIPHA